MRDFFIFIFLLILDIKKMAKKSDIFSFLFDVFCWKLKTVLFSLDYLSPITIKVFSQIFILFEE